ncbi:uncharacterized protein LOC125518701 [Triticum urartu]|uniref:DUF659 domain-containing protein n=1 Tax=Triticum urartu TaxID=4572 RepID=A0A8R7QY48_TRIUA|nr:uncharacterized protein LOC125518701 [Triticum urartu]
MSALIAENDKKKDKSLNKMLALREEVRGMYDQGGNEDEDCEIVEFSPVASGSSQLPKKPMIKGKMDRYRARPGAGKQTMMSVNYKIKEAKTTYDYICEFIIEGALAHNLASLKSFARMVEAIGQFGPGLKPPTPYQLASPLLKIQVSKVDEMLKVQKEAWVATGCSIMTHAWTDRRGRSLMNLVAHSSRGMCFLRAIKASMEVHDAKFIFSLVMSCISEICAEKIVQVVTDNASNNIAAAKLLKQKHPQIFWTSCAAHTINLMLQDIGNIPIVSSTITNGKTITIFFYAHTRLLAILRKYAKGDLVRAGATRFASHYLNLKSLYGKRKQLKLMFASNDWAGSIYAKKPLGKRVYKLVMDNKFWAKINLLVNYFEPLANVLRRVDGDTPAMGFLYGDLLQAKQEIVVRLNHVEKKYGPIWEIIDRRWDNKMKTALHKAGYFLNPFFYYDRQSEMAEEDFMEAVIECASVMYKNNIEVQDNIVSQLSYYTEAIDSFGTDMAIRQRKVATITPARWWTVHGTSAKDLKKMAIRILSLTCSSSAYERNWSAFERVHSKKRTRLGQKKLNDLVYVMFNKRLDSKYSERERDPLLAKYIEDEPPNEWMLDEELLQDDESSEDEAEIDINSKGKQKSVASRTRGKRARTNQDVEDEEEVAEEEEMEEEDENQEADEDNDEDQEVDIDLTVEDEEDGE